MLFCWSPAINWKIYHQASARYMKSFEHSITWTMISACNTAHMALTIRQQHNKRRISCKLVCERVRDMMRMSQSPSLSPIQQYQRWNIDNLQRLPPWGMRGDYDANSHSQFQTVRTDIYKATLRKKTGRSQRANQRDHFRGATSSNIVKWLHILYEISICEIEYISTQNSYADSFDWQEA